MNEGNNFVLHVQVMIVSLPKPKGILLGKVVLPRAKCGDFYEIYNAAGEMIYEMPTRVESGTSGYLFDIIRRPDLSTFDNFEVVAMVYIEGRNVVDVGLTEIKTTPAGDFHIRFREQIPTEEKALLVAAAFYVVSVQGFSNHLGEVYEPFFNVCVYLLIVANQGILQLHSNGRGQRCCGYCCQIDYTSSNPPISDADLD